MWPAARKKITNRCRMPRLTVFFFGHSQVNACHTSVVCSVRCPRSIDGVHMHMHMVAPHIVASTSCRHCCCRRTLIYKCKCALRGFASTQHRRVFPSLHSSRLCSQPSDDVGVYFYKRVFFLSSLCRIRISAHTHTHTPLVHYMRSCTNLLMETLHCVKSNALCTLHRSSTRRTTR